MLSHYVGALPCRPITTIPAAARVLSYILILARQINGRCAPIFVGPDTLLGLANIKEINQWPKVFSIPKAGGLRETPIIPIVGHWQ